MVNSEHHRKPKNAGKNIDLRVESMEGDKYPARRVWMQQMRSAVRGKQFGWGYPFRRPLINMLTWG